MLDGPPPPSLRREPPTVRVAVLSDPQLRYVMRSRPYEWVCELWAACDFLNRIQEEIYLGAGGVRAEACADDALL